MKIARQPEAIPKLWSVELLAAHWSMKPDSIRAMVRRGQLKGIKIGRLVMFDEADLARFLESRRAS
jgi:hypothetical protein